MFHNNFSASIVPGNELNDGYHELEHGTEYKLRLRNNRALRCDAKVEIDGECVGTWRIAPNNVIFLERPANVNRKFTFYKLDSAEGDKAALQDNDELGLIRVTFTPEKPLLTTSWADELHPRSMPPSYSKGARSSFDVGGGYGEPVIQSRAGGAGGSSYSAGGTGLGANSDQKFGSANHMDLDHSAQVIIHLRLVCRESKPEPDIIPLRGSSTPIPPRLF